MSNKPQLSFVPTPIGNLGDITKRSLETLQECDIIFAEDTRTAKSLMNAFDIKKPVESYHKDNEAQVSKRIVSLCNEGKKLCVISEAGSPCVSDPGNVLTSVLVDEGINFEALPGATAFVPALILSGFDVGNFYFHGFLPHKKSEKKKEAESLKSLNTAIAFYESPHRIKETLNILLDIFPTPISVSREITKMFEATYHINNKEDIEQITLKGEFVVVVNNRHKEEVSTGECKDTAEKLVKAGYKGKECVNILKALGYKRNEAYSAVEDIVNS